MSRARDAVVVGAALAVAVCGCKRRDSKDSVHADDPGHPLAHVAHPKLDRDDPRVAQVAASASGICARRGDGRISCWGQYGVDLDYRETVSPRELAVRDVVRLAAGWLHFCALHENGRVTCWGDDKEGQIDGQGEWEELAAPRMVAGVEDATDLALGEGHSCALRADGSVTCWGTGYVGELGDGTQYDSKRHPPRPVKGLPVPTKQLAAAGNHTCALGADALVRCWGGNYGGVLGDGTREHSGTPKLVAGLKGVRAIWAHKDFNCARVDDGSIACWGVLQLGKPLEPLRTMPAPTVLRELDHATDLALRGWHLCAVNDDATLSCFGNDDDGQLGDGAKAVSSVPHVVAGLTHVLSAAVTTDVSCALTEAREVFCWGGNSTSPVGDGTFGPHPAPTRVNL